MQRFSLLVFFFASVLAAHGQAMTMATYSYKTVKTSNGNESYDIGAPASVIPQREFSGALVYWKIFVTNFKAIKAKYRLEAVVMQVKDGVESVNYTKEMYIPTKNGWQYLFSEFLEGKYTIYLRDQDHPEDVYSKVSFTVPAKPKVDYKHNSTLVVCKSTDDNFNPIGQAAKVKAGDCMNFLYKAKDRIGYSTMVWNVVRVNDEGNEDYVTHLIQGTMGKPFRWLATDQGVCAFQTPGKYRIYLFHEDDYDTSITRGEDSEYIGKTEIIVY